MKSKTSLYTKEECSKVWEAVDEYEAKAKNVEMFHNVTGSAMKGAGWLFGCDWLELLGSLEELNTLTAFEGPSAEDYEKELAKIREDAIARYLTDHTIQPGELYEGLGALTAGTSRPGKHK